MKIPALMTPHNAVNTSNMANDPVAQPAGPNRTRGYTVKRIVQTCEK